MKIFLFTIMILTFIGCSPNLDSSLKPRVVMSENKDMVLKPTTFSESVTLGEVYDRRVDESLAFIEDRKVAPEGDVAETVKIAISDRLGASTFSSGSNSAIINVNITEWNVNVVPEFPSSKASSVATFNVEVKKNSRLIYTGTYSGESEKKNPFLTKHEVEKILGYSMYEAIEQLAQDPKFIAALRSSR